MGENEIGEKRELSVSDFVDQHFRSEVNNIRHVNLALRDVNNNRPTIF